MYYLPNHIIQITLLTHIRLSEFSRRSALLSREKCTTRWGMQLLCQSCQATHHNMTIWQLLKLFRMPIDPMNKWLAIKNYFVSIKISPTNDNSREFLFSNEASWANLNAYKKFLIGSDLFIGSILPIFLIESWVGRKQIICRKEWINRPSQVFKMLAINSNPDLGAFQRNFYSSVFI